MKRKKVIGVKYWALVHRDIILTQYLCSTKDAANQWKRVFNETSQHKARIARVELMEIKDE